MNEIFELIQELTGQRIPFPEYKGTLQTHNPFEQEGIGHSQLNEMLLTLGYDRVSYPFFLYLCEGKNKIDSLDALRSCVERFCTHAILLYGNVKFAFKTLSSYDEKKLGEALQQLQRVTTEHYETRHKVLHRIKKIDGTDVYYLGYLIAAQIEKKLASDPTNADAIKQKECMERIRKLGRSNHRTYLTYDHMDVYIATSMREKHEYFLVHEFIQKLFETPDLVPLNLRWFDPTQAYCDERIDKGLVEGLMVKRAKCTIYHVQETDTLGKDSELAATLAQGKPVVAYIPQLKNPAEFLGQAQLLARTLYPSESFEDLVLRKFLPIYYPLGAWTDPVVRGWLNRTRPFDLGEALTLLFEKAQEVYETRATTIKDSHPLGLQVNLATGVSNGVLVVRSVNDCAKLLRKIMLNEMEFDLEKKVAKNNKIVHWALREKISKCIFRVVTGDELLTNSFWNFYLKPSAGTFPFYPYSRVPDPSAASEPKSTAGN
ncbi:MAG: hypothetical protein ACREIJ_00740 [Nitrospiraceae bacterium]